MLNLLFLKRIRLVAFNITYSLKSCWQARLQLHTAQSHRLTIKWGFEHDDKYSVLMTQDYNWLWATVLCTVSESAMHSSMGRLTGLALLHIHYGHEVLMQTFTTCWHTCTYWLTQCYQYNHCCLSITHVLYIHVLGRLSFGKTGSTPGSLLRRRIRWCARAAVFSSLGHFVRSRPVLNRHN